MRHIERLKLGSELNLTLSIGKSCHEFWSKNYLITSTHVNLHIGSHAVSKQLLRIM